MSSLRILFVGVGSIAKRHIRNITAICREQNRRCDIDVFRSGIHKDVDEEVVSYIGNVYYRYSEVPSGYDIIFITNPTEYHIDTLRRFHDKGKNFFIEKPLCSVRQLADLRLDFTRTDSIYYVACPLRYTKVLQYVKKNIDPGSVLSVRSISSSYLPQWRPGIDYRDTYSAKKVLGGGVAIDLIHEWDYLSFLFGRPEKVYSLMKKVSDLEIDVEDIAIYIGEYRDKVVELHLDYLGRQPIRKMELFTKEDTIVCDLLNSTVRYMKQDKTIEFAQERDSYQIEELKYFMDVIGNKTADYNNILDAAQILKLAGGEEG